MALPTNRSSSSTTAEHIADHNTIHTQFNELEGHAADTTNVHGIVNTAQLITTLWGLLPINRISAGGVWTSRATFLSNAGLTGYTGAVEFNSETYTDASDPAAAGAIDGDIWERRKPAA